MCARCEGSLPRLSVGDNSFEWSLDVRLLIAHCIRAVGMIERAGRHCVGALHWVLSCVGVFGVCEALRSGCSFTSVCCVCFMGVRAPSGEFARASRVARASKRANFGLCVDVSWLFVEYPVCMPGVGDVGSRTSLKICVSCCFRRGLPG